MISNIYRIEPRTMRARVKLALQLLESALQVIVNGRALIEIERAMTPDEFTDRRPTPCTPAANPASAN
jgi:hypothetical protein